MGGTSELADYVIATYTQLEVSASSRAMETVYETHPGYGWTEPYAFYHPAVLEPPEGSDLMEAWQIYYRVAQKLGLALSLPDVGSSEPRDPIPLDMKREPSSDELLELACTGSVIPLAEVKKWPHGALFDDRREVVQFRDAACSARLQLADRAMLEKLASLRGEDAIARRGTGPNYPFQLICRRIKETINSSPRPNGIVRTGYNPLWMNPADMAGLVIRDGDRITIKSHYGEIPSFAHGDDTLRPGVVAMTHGFGAGHVNGHDPRREGSNVNEITSWEDHPDPYHGMPRMSAVPVQVRAE
jgi:anaerobic selenocysteine-containing dehydrogenase